MSAPAGLMEADCHRRLRTGRLYKSSACMLGAGLRAKLQKHCSAYLLFFSKRHNSMCKGFSSLPSSCLEKAKGMRVKLSHFADMHHKPKVQYEKGFQDLEALLNTKSGLQAFRGFLRSEFSEENLKFWLACEDYRVSPSKTKAIGIYRQFINPDAPQEVNLDAETREALLSVMDSLCADTFNEAQQRIYSLMAKDSFPRFLRSSRCAEAVKAF